MTDHAAVIHEKRAVAHRAVTEGVNVKYIDLLRRACYDACDLAESLLAERDAALRVEESLKQMLAAATKERDAALERAEARTSDDLVRERNDALDRAEAAEAERDAAVALQVRAEDRAHDQFMARKATEATLTRYRDALNHYANEDHWALDPATYDTTNTAGYAMWGYDGGHEEPWRIARAALDGPKEEAA